jgi:hypothetical protein
VTLNRRTLLLVALSALSVGASAQPVPPAQDHVLQFGGAQIAVAPPHASLDLGSAFTMEAWVYASAGEPYAFVLGKPHDPRHEDPFMGYALVFADDGARLEFVQTTGAPGSYRAVGTAGAFPLGRWAHVAATLGGGQMRLYVDGALAASGDSPGPPNAASLPFAVGGGAQADGSVIGGFRGGLRQVRVWGRALDGAEIAQRMGEALTGQEPGLVAYWPLDDGAGPASRDLGPSGLPLRLGTATGADAADPTWVLEAVLSGGPYFTARSTPLPPSEVNDVYVLDGDGPAQQVVVVHQLRWPPTVPATELPLLAFRNDGTGRFAEATAATLEGDPRTVHARAYAVADFTGDGRADMYVADHGTDTPPFPGHPNLLLVRQPDGRLADEAAARMSTVAPDFTHGLAVGDVTGDGRPDILSINSFEGTGVPPLLYVNDGAGRFVVENDRLPERVTEYERKYLAGEVVDVDRDGDGDLVLGGHNGSLPAEHFAHDAVFLNDGAGRFTEAPESTLPPRYGDASFGTVDVVSLDANADGWPDLLMAVYNDYGRDGRFYSGSQLLLNRGDGTFAEATDRLPPPPSDPDHWVVWHKPADVNGDGWTDLLVVVAGEGARLYLNAGDGRFEDATFLLPGRLYVAEVADVDGDGDPDVVGLGDGGLTVFENVAPFASAPSEVAPPVAPALVGPVGGAPHPVGGALLVWARVPTASAYDVEVAADPDFAEVILARAEVTTERLAVGLGPTEGSVYWRARARNTRGAGPWSEPAAFTVTGSTSADGTAAGALALAPPRPNPASSVTTIAYAVPRGGDVRLDVVDVLGRHVETLVAGPMPAGRHAATWDVSSRAPGTYFVRLRPAEGSSVRPVLVVR